MRAPKTAILLALTLLSSFARGQGRQGKIEHTLEWHQNLDTALAESADTGKPVLLVFR